MDSVSQNHLGSDCVLLLKITVARNPQRWYNRKDLWRRGAASNTQNLTTEYTVMKIFRNHQTVLLLSALLSLVFLISVPVFNVGVEKGKAQDGQSASLPGGQSLLPLTPDQHERTVTMAFLNTLERHHILQRTLGQSQSKEAFRLYIKKLDPRKLYFYQSDIDEFKTKYELKLCELINQRPVEVRPVFEIYNRYLTRLKERVEMVQHILSQPIDFTVDEEYGFDRVKDFTLDENIIKAKGLQTFPKTTEEAYELWRKRLKYELLSMRSEVIANKQKREKALAEGKEPPDIDDRDPVERLLKRYVSLQRRMLYEGRIDSAETLSGIRMRANDDVMELFLNSIAESLDPHSSYMSPSTEQAFAHGMQKALQGIGAQLSTEEGYTVVKELIRGGPAEKSGELQPKDKIQGVGQGRDGKIEEVIDFKITDVVQLIRGPKGTVVRLDVLPGGKGPSKIIEIVRDEVKLDDQAALSAIFEAGTKVDGTPYRIGFIELPDFYLDMDAVRRRESNFRSASADIRVKLRKFVEENIDAVVLDLRFNGGGSLQEAIAVSGLFLGAGVVVQTKDEAGGRPQPKGNTDIDTEWTGPLVVMTNKFSASASEIVAGAIKDHRRGLIVGDSNTLGKGTVQSVVNLGEQLRIMGSDHSYGSGKITIQGFYRPSGITTQGTGVEADIVLPSFSDVMENVTEAELDNVLTLQKVNPASNFAPKQLVSPQLIAELRNRSTARIRENEEFARQLEKIALYKESRAKRTTPLNETKYMEEMQRFNTDEWEREEIEDMLVGEKKITRNFYVDEVLAITVDYIKAAEELGIAFPRERAIQVQPRRTFFGLF